MMSVMKSLLLAAAALAAGVVLSPAASSAPSHPSDDKGFLNSSARCETGGPALAVGRTAQSLVVICPGADGTFDYRGVRLKDGAVLTAPAKPDGRAFTARNDAFTYTVTATELVVTSENSVIKREAMVEYRQPQLFPAEAGAPAR